MPALVLLLLPVLLGAFVTFNRLVCLEYTAHRENWVRDGRPLGFLWRPPAADCPGWWARAGWTFAQPRAVLFWLFRTPRWAAGNAAALRLVWRLRAFALVWNVGVVSAFAA